MSVTNEEVSGPNSIGGGGGSTPTPVTAASSGSSGSTSNSAGASASSVNDDVVKSGYLRKLKGKKKFFVLRKETEADKPARLEYYANERKFRMGQPPKRSIVLKACFNISRTESKCKYSVALHTHNDCVRIAMNSEDEMNDWLRVMNSLAGDEEVEDDDVPTQTKPHFEHIWLVTALNKGLGSKENILGPYRLCLTSKELTLLKVGAHDHNNSVVKFPLNVIRNVSHDATFGCFFHIEFGRLAATGPGQLSLKTEDNNIAQNMHLLILKAMQNYSKEDLIPRENGQRRARTYTWNETSMSASNRSNSFHNTPPGLNRINSMDGTMRLRTESMSSSERRAAGMSPPMPILSNPSIAFNSPLCSTGTDSASSSYSMELENNLNNNNSNPGSGLGHRGLLLPGLDYSKSCEEDESYVPYYPGDEQQQTVNSLRLPLHPDSSDYVDHSIVSSKETGSAAQTPSSYMEVQSPMSPFDNYMPMSPAGGIMAGNGSAKSSGKLSVSHSRNSSLIEENEGYVPMIPGSVHSRSESGACSTAGSTTGLDEQYIEMDFARKLDLSNDEMQSSESIQSGTPSSEYNLDKVSSYLSDDMEGMRPARAYSVGSKSDTSSTGKGRSGKMRLEAVPESRMRSCSMGANSKPVRPILPSGRHCSMLQGVSTPKSGGIPVTPLSSSWSGSASRMQPYNKYPPIYSHFQNQNSHSTASESADSDLMELDFSHNKKGRKRSLPGPGGNLSSSSNSGSSNITKISPVPKNLLATGGETPPGGETPEVVSKSSTSSYSSGYATSEPISIQKCNKSLDGGMGYPDTGSSILTRMTGMDLKKLKELDDSGAYLDMDFSNSVSSSSSGKAKDKSYSTASFPRKSSQTNLPSSNTFFSSLLDSVKSIGGSNNGGNSSSNTNSPAVVVRAHDPYVSSGKSLNFLSSNLCSPVAASEPPPLSRSLSSSSNISTTSNNSNSSSTSCVSVKSQHPHPHQCQAQQPLMSPTVETSHVIANTSQHSTATSVLTPSLPTTLLLATPGTTNTTSTPLTTTATSSVTTATSMGLSRIEESPEKQDPLRINHLNPIQSPPPSPSIISPDGDQQVTYTTIHHAPQQARRNLHFTGGTGCGTSAASTAKGPAITYAQIDFVKSPEVNVKNN